MKINTVVTLVTSDKGWILEKLAHEITSRISYAKYADTPDPRSLITYYITYSCRGEKISPMEVAYFAHMEHDEATKKKFFEVAKSVDHCVCHADLYNKLLQENGIANVTTINPGVDLDLFSPKLQIGVVGRTYHTGRKGEKLVAQLMDIDWIDWHFTGEGWPGPALRVSPTELPDFYRKMDYILVPALYEGGPMCVIEALACGTKVIAPPIGWVPQFPHIEYKTGDAADLRRVLEGVYEEKRKLRESVANVTWDAWAEGHDRLFRRLAKKYGKKFPSGRLDAGKSKISTAIVLHGSEKNDKGGPSVRAPRTAALLNAWTEYDATLCHAGAALPRESALAHVFNVWRLNTCKTCVEAAFKNMKPVVLSSIFLDLSEIKYFKQLKKIFSQYYDDEDLRSRIAALQAIREKEIASGERYKEAFPGHFDMLREILYKTDHVIFLSEHERRMFTEIGFPARDSSVIFNPVDSTLFSSTSPELFSKQYGISDYVLCVGRLETRKNQLMLAYALKDANIPLVYIGNSADQEYSALVRKHAGGNALFIDRLDPNSPMLASAYAGARVYCLPSWAEGASLSALEAASAGCSMVLSNRSSEREYFSSYARYCDPFSLDSIYGAVTAAYEEPFPVQKKKELQAYVAEKFSWDIHIEKTALVYNEVLQKKHDREQRYHSLAGDKKLYIDVTSSANRKGPPSGIARVESYYAAKLYEMYPEQVQLVLWNSLYCTFVPVSYEQLRDNSIKEFKGENIPASCVNVSSQRPYDTVQFQPGATLLVLGGAWISNSRYARDLGMVATVCKLDFIVFIHDIIQAKFPHWFPDGVGQNFSQNCKKLIEAAHCIITNSQCTTHDVLEFAASQNIPCPPVSNVRFGDDIHDPQEFEDIHLQPVLDVLNGAPFVLCVSALDIRKNHSLLYNIWRKMILEHDADKVPHLICVGSKGWSIDPFLAMLSRDTVVKNHIHIFHNIDDAVLDWLYRRCLFTVYPSLYEGWGLPVAESLAYGKICVAARAGSVPEISPAHTDLLDPYDVPAWYATITGYAFNRKRREARAATVARYRPVSWHESSQQLIAILRQQKLAEVEWPFCSYDRQVVFSLAKNEGERFLGGGWDKIEEKGIWGLGSRATLICRLRMRDTAAFFLMHCRGYVPEGEEAVRVAVSVNGTQVQELAISQHYADYSFVIPPQPATRGEYSDIRIDFTIRNPRRPCEHEDVQDRRPLGFFLCNFILRPCSEKELFYESVIERLDAMVKGGGACFRSLLQSRPDLAHALCDNTVNSSEKLLFWAWRYGCDEQPELAPRRQDFFEALVRLHALPYKPDSFPKYTMLVHSLWLAREDLHAVMPAHQEGQEAIVSWFDTCGIDEYNLRQIVGIEPDAARGQKGDF